MTRISCKLPLSFYRRPDVVSIARELLGKKLVTCIDGRLTSGIIVETEAYAGVGDRASHGYGGRRTARNEMLYHAGGVAYVYLCYGIHHLFNVVTNQEGVPHAVLVRAVEPVEGIPEMLRRTGKQKPDYSLTAGPGALSRALGIHYRLHNGEPLTGNLIWIEDAPPVPEDAIVATTRVGVAYAQEDAWLPYRFYVRDNPWVSKAKGLKA
ncbi:DNA-3-methyladenine glycosylase [Thermoflavifilum aggregans]|uniref:Putative 3-methyladenine DNA glycosylase n=1 Tax=Thermoflavifilum aggregans TaxID=454188 RepID=A0A2M9CT46_9BACT|nr:DNA-3-methyladenine glycosylase [Thermoflavifilum aggregans]PJJ75063.1 DNA-3-methyladenine glycosylase [Thermoflavifilum aggregans]